MNSQPRGRVSQHQDCGSCTEERGLNLPLYAYIYDTNGQFQFYPNFVLGGTPGSPTLEHLNLVEIIGTGSASTGAGPMTGGFGYQDNISSFSLQAPGTLSKQRISMSSEFLTNASTLRVMFMRIRKAPTSAEHAITAPAYQNANACGYFGGSPAGISIAGDGTVNRSTRP